ncbi:gluconokinase [Candidatus Bipolaricaulota bacterium]|nr:gluconokinase [Candidatus Bipolaricaulota bacterium]
MEKNTGSKSVYIGVDIGTGSTRAVAYDEDLNVQAIHYEEIETQTDQSGQAVQDPKKILKNVRKCLTKVAKQNAPVKAISFSAMLHSLVGLDDKGEPLTPLFTWADTRGREYADRLGDLIGDFHSRTGCVLHPMYPAAKLLWLKEEEPEKFRSVPLWGSIKSFVFMNLLDRFVEGRGVASASGLLNTEFDWDGEILSVLHLSPENLPTTMGAREKIDGDTDIPGLDKASVYPGGGDGMLAHLSTAGLVKDRISSTIGTSGALRVATTEPLLDREGKLWSYDLFPDRWICGGALNNGGLALDWFIDNFVNEDVREKGEVYAKIDRCVETIRPGSSGLIFAPFLTGERSPGWRPYMKGGFLGLTISHGRAEMARAIMEGVTYRLKGIEELLTPYLQDDITIRASGGYTRSNSWLQIQADVFDAKIEVPEVEESAARGAALVAMQGEGEIRELPEPLIGKVIRPEHEKVELYESLYRDQAEYYRFLADYYKKRV